MTTDSATPALPRPRALRRPSGDSAWAMTAVLAAALLALPILSIVWIALSATENGWPHLLSNVLPSALFNTLMLLAGAGMLALVIGTTSAWLVTMFRFPGRSLADRLLVLPLAMPVYIVAFAYVELLGYAGPVQTFLRQSLGPDNIVSRVLPEIRSLTGAIGLFAAVLYPYVYLTARASFVQQSVCALEVARTLGRSASGSFFAVALPMARPALVAGVALVLMECLNDLGAVQHLGVETLSASIYATWTQRANLPGAAQISLVLLVLVIALLVGERAARGEAAFHTPTGRYRAIPFETLTGWRAALALTAVLMPVLVGFVVPFVLLASRALSHLNSLDYASYAAAARNSVLVACLASAVAVILALVFAYAARLHRSAATRFAARSGAFGYALPGTVLAIGLLAPLAAFDNAVDAWMRAMLGVSTGLLLSGSLFAITLALVIRFLAVALGSVESGLDRISLNIDAAARTLGSGTLPALRRIHLPMLKPALGAAALLVFVDAMKELPATLLLRPFNFDTLATRIYSLAATEQFEEAAAGSVAIVLIGLLPVLLLHKAIAGGRTGGSAS